MFKFFKFGRLPLHSSFANFLAMSCKPNWTVSYDTNSVTLFDIIGRGSWFLSSTHGDDDDDGVPCLTCFVNLRWFAKSWCGDSPLSWRFLTWLNAQHEHGWQALDNLNKCVLTKFTKVVKHCQMFTPMLVKVVKIEVNPSSSVTKCGRRSLRAMLSREWRHKSIYSQDQTHLET